MIDTNMSKSLDLLASKHPRIKAQLDKHGYPTKERRLPSGYGGLAKIIVGQQISPASAENIFARLIHDENEDLTADRILALGHDELRSKGLTTAKCRSLIELAEKVSKQEVDLVGLIDLEAEEAISELVKLRGVGPWTAEIYLLYALQHPDIFPSGDMGLRRAVARVYPSLSEDDGDAINEYAKRWSPHRSAATTFFWHLNARLKES